MSLEEALAANTAAIKEQTAFLKTLKGGTAAAPEKPAAAGKPAAGKAKKIDIDTIKARFGAFLSIEDKKERKERVEQVRAFAEHFGVTKMTDLEEDNWAPALEALTKLEAGEKPDFMDDDAGGGDDALV